MSENFMPGQTIYWHDGAPCKVIALADDLVWVRNEDGTKPVNFTNRFTAVDPKAKPKSGLCQFCGKPGTLYEYYSRSCQVLCECECGCRGPLGNTSAEAVEAWNSIRVQGKFGTVKYNSGFEAIDDIHSIHEHCFQKCGMPNEPIGCPGAPGSIRNQIIRFIDKLVAEKNAVESQLPEGMKQCGKEAAETGGQCCHEWVGIRMALVPLVDRNTMPPLEWCKHCGLLRMLGFKD